LLEEAVPPTHCLRCDMTSGGFVEYEQWERSRPEGSESGGGVFGERAWGGGSDPPPHQLESLGERCND